MKKMNDSVKYQLERAEDALRTALKFADQESVYVISAISKALMEIDNTMFAERIEAAAKEGNTAAQGFISIDKEEREDGKVAYNFKYANTKVKYDEHMGVFAPNLGLDEDPYSYYKPKDDALVDLS
jgi:hypothetical protein